MSPHLPRVTRELLIVLIFAPVLAIAVVFAYLAIRQGAQVAGWLMATCFGAALATAVYAWRAPGASVEQLLFWGPGVGGGFTTLIYLKHALRWADRDKRKRVSAYRTSGASPLARITDGA